MEWPQLKGYTVWKTGAIFFRPSAETNQPRVINPGFIFFSGIFSMATICLYHVKNASRKFLKTYSAWFPFWMASLSGDPVLLYKIPLQMKAPFFLRLDWTREFHVSLSIIPDALKDFFPYVLSEKKHDICFVAIYPRMGIMIYNLCINSC